MDKYRLFDKVGKCKACTFYKAQSNSKREKVIVKKLHKGTSWQQILKNRELSLCKSDNKYFPKVLEMIKDEDRFYAILQPLEENLQTVIHNSISKQDILKISKLLIHMAINFWENKIIPKQLRPSYIFLNNNRNVIKLANFENALGKDIAKMDLVQLQDMKYLSPEQVLTSKDIDERATIFNIGLIIYQLITGKSLLKANTKINYMYEICQLFPEQKAENIVANSGSRINQLQHSKLQQNDSKLVQSHIATSQSFQKTLQQQQISNQFIALLKQMLRIDRNERLRFENLLESFQVIAQHQQQFQKNKHLSQSKAKFMNKPHGNQVDVNNEILQQLMFDFQAKPTLSTLPIIKNIVCTLPTEKNVQDDAVQPIIIKQSSKPIDEAGNLMVNTLPIGFNKPMNGASKQILQTTKDTAQSRGTNNYSFSSVRRPQLTNYAMNEANLGVQVGLNPTIFSDNDV